MIHHTRPFLISCPSLAAPRFTSGRTPRGRTNLLFGAGCEPMAQSLERVRVVHNNERETERSQHRQQGDPAHSCCRTGARSFDVCPSGSPPTRSTVVRATFSCSHRAGSACRRSSQFRHRAKGSMRCRVSGVCMHPLLFSFHKSFYPRLGL